MRLINVGYGNLVVAERVVAVVAPGSSPIKRLREEAREMGKLVDATQGRRTRSIVIMDTDHLILSAVQPDTLAQRIVGEDGGEDGATITRLSRPNATDSRGRKQEPA